MRSAQYAHVRQLFGGRELALLATDRVRTENNCVPRDVVSVAGHLLFGFQVFIGLKSETTVERCIFSAVPIFSEGDRGRRGIGLGPRRANSARTKGRSRSLDRPGAFLANADFAKEFTDVFRYFKNARLLQLRRADTRLLAVVQIGDSVRDVKVFRFAIDARRAA